MDLNDLVGSLKRAVAPPGEFTAYFPSTSDADMRDLLADSVAEAMLDGFLATTELDVEGAEVSPDLTHAQQALVILYGMARVLRARVANAKNRTRYKAGTVEAETESSATVLVQLLKQTEARKTQLLNDARTGNLASSFAMVDMYVTKSINVSGPAALGYDYSQIGASRY